MSALADELFHVLSLADDVGNEVRIWHGHAKRIDFGPNATSHLVALSGNLQPVGEDCSRQLREWQRDETPLNAIRTGTGQTRRAPYRYRIRNLTLNREHVTLDLAKWRAGE